MARELSVTKKKKQYPLRGQTSVTSKDPACVTPTKPTTATSSKASSNPTTPSSKICAICNGMEEMRSLKLKEVVEESTSCIDDYKLLTKSYRKTHQRLIMQSISLKTLCKLSNLVTLLTP